MAVYGITTTPAGTDLHIIDEAALPQYMTLRSEMRDSGSNPRRAALLSAVTVMFEDFCRCAFVQRNVVEYVDGSGLEEQVLSLGPVVAVNSVKYAYQTPDLAAETALTEGDDYDVDAERGSVYLHSACFPEGRMNVLLDYDAGYSETSMELGQARAAAVIQLNAMWREWDGKLAGLQQNSSGEKQEQRIPATTTLLPEVRKMLEPLRRFAR